MHPFPNWAWYISISSLPRFLLHLRPPPRLGQRGGAPTSHQCPPRATSPSSRRARPDTPPLLLLPFFPASLNPCLLLLLLCAPAAARLQSPSLLLLPPSAAFCFFFLRRAAAAPSSSPIPDAALHLPLPQPTAALSPMPLLLIPSL